MRKKKNEAEEFAVFNVIIEPILNVLQLMPRHFRLLSSTIDG
jgi:hypothetical protein